MTRQAPSARGLFRATGKQARPISIMAPCPIPADWPPEVASLDLGDGYVKTRERPRERDDFYATREPEPIRALVAHEGERLRAFARLWEPAAGDGTMVRDLSGHGFEVVASDLVDRGCGARIVDFLATTEPFAPAIVTNPPFNLCNWRDGRGAWIEHALGRLDVAYMALLLSWNWPAAGGLAGLWRRFPPARVYLMRWKIDFTGQGAPPMLNGWFIWDRAHAGETALRMMDRADAPGRDMFGGAA